MSDKSHNIEIDTLKACENSQKNKREKRAVYTALLFYNIDSGNSKF